MFVTSRYAGSLLSLLACALAPGAENRSGAGVYRDPSAWELFIEAAPLRVAELARFDARELGGDDDGAISAADAVWPRLRLWLDLDADGVAARAELRTLAGYGIRALTLKSNCSGMQPPHEGHPRVHVELAEHLAHLRLDRVHRDAAAGGDLRDRPPLAELLRDVGLGVAEFRHGRHGAVVPWPAPARHIYICTDAAQRPLMVSR
jgi:hypothetical protein